MRESGTVRYARFLTPTCLSYGSTNASADLTRWRSSCRRAGGAARGEDLLRHLSFGVQARARHAGRPARAQEVRGQRPAGHRRAERLGPGAPRHPPGPHGRGPSAGRRARASRRASSPTSTSCSDCRAKRPRIARSPSPSPRSSSTWRRGSTAMPSCAAGNAARGRRTGADRRRRAAALQRLESRARSRTWARSKGSRQDLVALRRRPAAWDRALRSSSPASRPRPPRRGRDRIEAAR